MLTFSSDVKMCFGKSLPLLMSLYHVPMLLRAPFVTRFGLVTPMQYPHSRPVPFLSFPFTQAKSITVLCSIITAGKVTCVTGEGVLVLSYHYLNVSHLSRFKYMHQLCCHTHQVQCLNGLMLLTISNKRNVN